MRNKKRTKMDISANMDPGRLHIAMPKDHDKFDLDTYNRPIKARFLHRLIASMQKYGFLPSDPIVVAPNGDRWAIRKGHHRYAAAKSLGIPFYYIIDTRTDVPIADTERSTHSWNSTEYIHAEAARGNPVYQKLMQYHERTGIAMSLVVRLLTVEGSVRKNDDLHLLVDTSLAYSVEHIIEAIKKVDARIGKNSNCVHAVMDLCYLENFSPARMIKKVQAFPGKLTAQPNVFAYMQMLEGVYNYYSHEPALDLAVTAQRQAAARRKRTR